MNALSLATKILGGTELSPGQLAQLRALDRKYAQRLYSLLQEAKATPAGVPSEAAAAELRTRLVSDILALLTPEQQQALRQS